MLPRSWKPMPAAGLTRLGPDDDGGYVVAARAVLASDQLLSFGLNADWRFEAAYLAANPRGCVVCLDGSVDGRFWRLWIMKKLLRLRPLEAAHYLAYRRFFASPRAEHRRLMIGYDAPGSVSLDTLLRGEMGQRILLKIDIEGWEHRILDQIVIHRHRFTGIVMEIHDLDLNRPRVRDFLAALTGFTIVYLTPNNFGGVDANGDPLVVEISLMRDEFVDAPKSDRPVKSPQHIRNDPAGRTIELMFEPA